MHIRLLFHDFIIGFVYFGPPLEYVIRQSEPDDEANGPLRHKPGVLSLAAGEHSAKLLLQATSESAVWWYPPLTCHHTYLDSTKRRCPHESPL